VVASSASVTYNGTVIANSATANGIELTNNAGGTITLGGRLDIDTVTGIGVNVFNTTIGGPGPTVSGTDLIGTFGMTFESVSVGNGASGPTNGIRLDNAGSGGFTITGTGANGSGGTIQDTTSDAIVLRNGTQNVELTNIILDDVGQHGVLGTGVVTYLVVNNSQLSDIGDSAGEAAFSFDNPAGNNIAGQLTLNNVDVTRYFENGLNIFATSGTVTVDVINGSDFVDGADTAGMGQAIIIETEGSAGADLNVNGSLFDDVENFPNGGSFHMIVTDARTLLFDIQGNTQNDLPGDGIIVAATSGGGSISGRIGGPNPADGNTINGGLDSFGFPVSDGITVSDIGVDATIAEAMTLLIQNNTIDANGGDDGIQFAVGDNDGTYDITIRDNAISNTGSEGIRFFLDDDNLQAPSLDLDVIDNSFTSIGDGAIELATRDAAVACANFTGNDDGAAGSPGTIEFDERTTSSISITQASLAALATANSGANAILNGLSNPISFNASCSTALPAHP
jgi:hypothetical protein